MTTFSTKRARGTKKPGEFKAVCRQVVKHPMDELDHEVLATAQAAGTKAEVIKGVALIPIPCTHEFTDRVRFEEHLESEHGRKFGSYALTRDNDVHNRLPDKIVMHKGADLPVKPWRGPRLSEDGKVFEPKDLEPGATVAWRELVGDGEIHQREWVERSGQVWCAGWRPKSAWVIPFELFEGETAVMVELSRDGSLHYYSTQRRLPQRVA